jgi:predicted permease
MSWFNRVSNLLRPTRIDQEVDEEPQFHLDARVQDNLNAGMSAPEAQANARKRFGNPTLVKHDTREANTVVWIETIGQDARYAFRSLRRSPAFTAIAVCALALGIGANTSVFTVVNGVLLRPLPFPQPDRLLLISYKPLDNPFLAGPGLADGYYLEFEKSNRSFEAIATFGRDAATLTGAGDAVRVPAATVTASFFRVLEVHPALGRSFVPQEERTGNTAILSDSLWRGRFHSDPEIVGKTLTLEGKKCSVIGVMPPGFTFPGAVDLWLPLQVGGDPGNSYFRPVFGRLRASVSLPQARAEFDTLAPHLPIGPRERRNQMLAEVLPLKDLLTRNIQSSLLIFMGAVAFVLLIACANVANLQLMRGAARRQEIAVRAALGARRGRLIRQLLTESVMVSMAGAAAGILLTAAAVPALLALAPEGRVPRANEIHIDVPVLGFAVLLGALTGILFGLFPALQAGGRGPSDWIGRGGRTATGRERPLSALVVAEVALALVLLAGAGLMLKSFSNMRAVNPGFLAENTLTVAADLPEVRYPNASALQSFDANVLAKLASLPGVSAVGAVNWLPLTPFLISGDFHLEGGRPLPNGYTVDKPAVSAGYFRAMGIRLLRGRAFTDHDTGGSPGVAVISESVARTLWPDGDAIAKRLTLEDRPEPQDWLTIVGIVDDVRQESLTANAHAAIYQPYDQVTRAFFLSHMTLIVRTAADVRAAAPAMRDVLRRLDPYLPVAPVTAMTDVVAATTAEPRFQARLISVFSLLALLLATIGVYGVLAYGVAQRTREIGIRMALGAERSDIARLVLRRSALLVTAGLAIGLVGAAAATRVLSRLLFEVAPTDPATFAAVAAGLGVVALVAGSLPARRAAKVDPLHVLRWE